MREENTIFKPIMNALNWVINSIIYVFIPPKLVLSNGKIVRQKWPILPYIVIVLTILLISSANITQFDYAILMKRGNQFFVILKQMFLPFLNLPFKGRENFVKYIQYFDKIKGPLIETIQMSILGTIIGAVTALPIGILASSNINKDQFSLSIIRFILSIIRTIPVLVYALIARYILGGGAFTGTVALALFTFGIVTKLLYEYVETLPMGSYEAVESTGASKPKAFIAAILPQILPMYVSQTMYSFEINVRNAAILGYVGAGGIGVLIEKTIGFRWYDQTGKILISLLITVLIIEGISRYLRKRLT